MKKILKQPLWLFTICMAVVLVFSLFANIANTSLYKVNVKTVNFDTENNNGNIEGLLYTPKGCNADNPCPVIVTTHGYLNSKEMQDAPSIELSKRGYIVLAIDMYDHGGSTWDTPYQFGFFMSSMWDAVKWVYDQPYTLKDASGNGMIAVSGHSMGGYSTEMAVISDAMAMASQGHRKIAVSLSVGADYRYTNSAYIPLFGDRSSGMIIGHFDEFFGDGKCQSVIDEKTGAPTMKCSTADTVVYKDYVKTAEGKSFLGLAATDEAEAGKFYEYAGGQRVIYTPYETHPWNHFSTETTANMIEFYDTAFDYQLEKSGLSFETRDAKGQTWWLKEAFECIAMIGLLVAVVPTLSLLLKVPFFAKVKTDVETLPVEKESSKGKRLGLVLTALITSLIPAAYFPTFINRSSNLSVFTKVAEAIMLICLVVAIGAWLICLAAKMFKEDGNEKARAIAWSTTKGSIIISAFAFALRYLSLNANEMLKSGYFFNAPTANDIGFWALISAAISLVVISIVHFVARKEDGATIRSYGLAAGVKQVLLALLISVVLFVGLYLVVFLIGWIFNTDFRLWVYAIKSFKWHHFVSFLRYVPIYFVFYFVNSIVITSNTKDVKGWKGYAYALFLGIGGLLLFLAYQYGSLFITGTAAVPSLALNSILLIGLVPSLAIAAIFAKKFYEKTNNIWTSAFFNTFLFTMIAIANTTIYLLAM